MKGITDIHIHIVPGVDDGARNIEEALDEIKLEINSGVKRIIATPHSSAFDYTITNTWNRFNELKEEISKRNLAVDLYLGCEILCFQGEISECIRNIETGKYPTIAGSKYVLIEFDAYGSTTNESLRSITEIKESGFIPIIAHVERYNFTDMQAITKMREAGALIQINLYSIKNDSSVKRREFTQGLLLSELVDFIGTDAHRINHRPPMLEDGILWIEDNCSERYVERIFHENMDGIINGV